MLPLPDRGGNVGRGLLRRAVHCSNTPVLRIPIGKDPIGFHLICHVLRIFGRAEAVTLDDESRCVDGFFSLTSQL